MINCEYKTFHSYLPKKNKRFFLSLRTLSDSTPEKVRLLKLCDYPSQYSPPLIAYVFALMCSKCNKSDNVTLILRAYAPFNRRTYISRTPNNSSAHRINRTLPVYYMGILCNNWTINVSFANQSHSNFTTERCWFFLLWTLKYCSVCSEEKMVKLLDFVFMAGYKVVRGY